MATANPPSRGHIIDRLLAIDGDSWVRLVMIDNPGLLRQARRDAERCSQCANQLARIFPDGVPEHHDLGGFTPQDLERVFEELAARRSEDERRESPGDRPRGDDG